MTESTGAAGWLWSTPADLARWGTFLADGDDAVLPKAVLDRMARVQAMVDEERWSMGWGLGLELYRRGDRVLVGHGGAMPGSSPASSSTARGASAPSCSRTPARRRPERLRSTSRSRPSTHCQPGPAPWTPGAAPPPELEGILGLWWTEGEQIVLSLRDGRFQAELVGGPVGSAASPGSSPRASTAGVSSRDASAASSSAPCRDETASVTKLYFATYPLTRQPTTFGG